VAIEDLEENGLYKYLPELKDARGYQSLFLRAAHLRSRIFPHPRVSFEEGLVACRALGDLFGEFVKPATVSFLTLYPRPDGDNYLLQAIADSTRNLGPSKRGGHRVFSYIHHGVDVKNLHEVVQFFAFLREIAAEEAKEDKRSVADSHLQTELAMSMQNITCE
jgi:hypothetical protein